MIFNMQVNNICFILRNAAQLNFLIILFTISHIFRLDNEHVNPELKLNQQFYQFPLKINYSFKITNTYNIY